MKTFSDGMHSKPHQVYHIKKASYLEFIHNSLNSNLITKRFCCCEE